MLWIFFSALNLTVDTEGVFVGIFWYDSASNPPEMDPSKDAQQHHGENSRLASLSLAEFSGVPPVLTNSDPHKRLPDFG